MKTCDVRFSRNSRGSELFAGIKAELPLLIGVIPFGLIYGVLALSAGIPPMQAQAMSAIVFAGSSQFILTQLVHTHVPALVMVLTVAVVNLRHALYSLSLVPYLKHLRPAWKWFLGYLLTDEAYAVSVIHYQTTITKESGTVHQEELVPDDRSSSIRDYRHWFLLGSGLTLWTSWQLSTAAGIFLGAVVPESWSLDFSLALTFISIVVPNIKDRAALAVALSAGLTAMLAFSMPYKLGLMTAALVGILAGLLVEGEK
jgi:predicted branched-subunit amino acid permease